MLKKDKFFGSFEIKIEIINVLFKKLMSIKIVELRNFNKKTRFIIRKIVRNT